MNRKDKKNVDRFSITIVGAIVYSVLLILVMGGVYVGVKVVFANHDSKAAKTETVQDTSKEKEEAEQPKTEAVTAEDKTIAETQETADDANEEETVQQYEHEADVSKAVDSATGYVDYSKIVFKPAKRDTKLKWKDTVFSRIEDVDSPKDAPVNAFTLKRCRATLADQKTSEYFAYTDPESGELCKIKEVTNCGEEYGIIDYYYDGGSINYIAQYNMVIDKPVPISSKDIDSRYYFCSDVLVKYIYCSDGKATEYSLSDLSSYSEGTIQQYDYLEKEMINRAYIVYNLAQTLEETELLYGYVLDEFSVPVEDAAITVTNDNDGKTAATAVTDGDGYYKFSLPEDEDAVYTVNVSKDTMNSVDICGITALPGSGKYFVPTPYLNYEENGGVYNVVIMARDAFDSTIGLSKGSIKLREGINNRSGDVIAAGELDETGSVTVPMAAGTYTAEVSKGGYETTYFPVVVRMDHQAAVGYAVSDVAQDEYKVVLSWESSPLDLDLKVISQNQERIIKSSVDSVGSTMAEALTIEDAGCNDYSIYVEDYTGVSASDPLSYNMTKSSAEVYVYDSDGQIAAFQVPQASAGICWKPFTIHNNKVLADNSYYYCIENDPVWDK